MAKLYTPDALKASRLPVFCPDMEDMWTYNGRHVDCEFVEASHVNSYDCCMAHP